MRTIITSVRINCDDCKKEITDYGVYPPKYELCRQCEYARVVQSLTEVKPGQMFLAPARKLCKCVDCNGVGKVFADYEGCELNCERCFGTGNMKYD